MAYKLTRGNGCPKCKAPLHYSAGIDEQLCLECNWQLGDEYVGDWPPEHIYPLAEWHMLSGLLYKQMKLKYISYNDYEHLIDQMAIGKIICK